MNRVGGVGVFDEISCFSNEAILGRRVNSDATFAFCA